MLDVAKIDLSSLADALEDHSDETSWWLDPETGELETWSGYPYSEFEGTHPGERGLLEVEAVPSSVGYRDMEDFIGRVRDPRARDHLRRAIEGRGAFRRFKDTLSELPELRTAWFAFHDARLERRALAWLAHHGVIDPRTAEHAIGSRADPDLPELGSAFDPTEVARAVAVDLRALYDDRLRRVLLFGSWAREDAHPDSAIDLLVVLDEVDSVWDELRTMDPILWTHSFANDTVVTAVPVAEADLRARRWPLLRCAIAEGRDVA